MSRSVRESTVELLPRRNRDAVDAASGSLCQSCGACCATYRVSFSRRELDTEPRGWPSQYTESIGRARAAMLGTMHPRRRCAALVGEVGVAVTCSIYGNRPTACRIFAPDAASGHGDPACDDARRIHGMPVLAGSYDSFPIA